MPSVRRRKPVKKKRPKLARNCTCETKRPLHPLSNHVHVCPVYRIHRTTNGRIIADMLVREKMGGNPRDFVILSGTSMLEYNGTWEVQLDDGYKLRFTGVLLVHKRKLHTFIGAEQAARYWHLGRRVNTAPPPPTAKS